MFGANLTKLTAVFPEPRTEPRSVFFSSLSSGTSEHICGTSANSQRVHLEFRCINFLVLAKLVFRCNQTESSHHFLLKLAFLEANLRGCTLTLRFQWDFSIFLLTDGESCSSWEDLRKSFLCRSRPRQRPETKGTAIPSPSKLGGTAWKMMKNTTDHTSSMTAEKYFPRQRFLSAWLKRHSYSLQCCICLNIF